MGFQLRIGEALNRFFCRKCSAYSSFSRKINNKIFQLLIILATGMIAYSNSFSVPFQWDDIPFIANNPGIKDPGMFFNSQEKLMIRGIPHVRQRIIVFLSFALNYRIHQLRTCGYHAVNFIIHGINGLLIYGLITSIFQTPFFRKRKTSLNPRTTAFYASLLFISHPLQTMAVTYIYQRLASLVALFYFLSAFLFIKYRLEQNKTKAIFFYTAAFLSTLAAMKTKENAFTLPFVLLLIEHLFFRGPWKSRLIRMIPFLLALTVIPASFISFKEPLQESTAEIDAMTKPLKGISRLPFFYTQLKVLVIYLRLLFFPVGQSVIYYIERAYTLFNVKVLLSVLFLSSLFFGAVIICKRSRKAHGELRVVSLGIFWFFITISVESGFVPIIMLQEYRVYLPSFGIFMTFSAGIFYILQKVERRRMKKVIYSLLIVIPVLLTGATFARNRVWQSRISLWKDVTEKQPYIAKAFGNLGEAYQEAGRIKEAVEQFEEAIRLKPDYAAPYSNLGMIKLSQGKADEAIDYYRIAMVLEPDWEVVYNNLGNAYLAKNKTEKAMYHYLKALELKPTYAEAHNNLGVAYSYGKQFDKAKRHHELALKFKPDFAGAHYNLGLLYAKTGLYDKAALECRKALNIIPDYEKAQQLLERMKSAGGAGMGSNGSIRISSPTPIESGRR